MTTNPTRDQQIHAILTECMPGDVATLIIGYKNESWALQREEAGAAICRGTDWKRWSARQPACSCYFTQIGTVSYCDTFAGPYKQMVIPELTRRMLSRHLLVLGEMGLVRPIDLTRHPTLQCGTCCCDLCVSADYHRLFAQDCVASDRFPSNKPCKRRLIIIPR